MLLSSTARSVASVGDEGDVWGMRARAGTINLANRLKC